MNIYTKRTLAKSIFFAAIGASSFSATAQTSTSIIGTVNSSPLLVTASPTQFAGAISSIFFRGQQYINSDDHGRELQSASSFDNFGECFNPTEAGTLANGTGAVSSSILGSISTTNNVLQTDTNMAFWLAPGQAYGKTCGATSVTTAQNKTVVSNHILTKTVSFNQNGISNLIGYKVNFYVPEAHSSGAFEAETAYMPPAFNTFLSYDKNNKSLSLLAASANGNTSQIPVILSTSNGASAMAIIASGTGSSYTHFYYEYYYFPNVTAKQGCLYYVGAITAGTTLNFSCPIAIGTVDEVIAAMNAYPSASTDADSPIYRFHFNGGHHFYTLSYNEGAGAGSTFGFEGTGWHTFPTNTGGLVPLYRCSIGSSRNDHFASLQSACEGGYNEGSFGFVSNVSAAGLAPLYRFYSSSGADHLITTNYSEGSGTPGYVYEEILGYVPTK